MKTAKEILDIISAEGVEFIRLQFTDIFGHLKNVAVTAGQLSKVLVDKYRIDGAVLFEVPAHADTKVSSSLSPITIHL